MQIASLVAHEQNDDGYAKVAVHTGCHQTSGLLVFIVAILSTHGADENDDGIYLFYFSIFGANCVAALSFIWLLFGRNVVTDSMFCRDNIMQIQETTESLLPSNNLSGEDYEDEDTDGTKSFPTIFQ